MVLMLLLLLLIFPILILALNVKLSTALLKLWSGWVGNLTGNYTLTTVEDLPSAKLMDLPVDILIDVFSRLPATSLLRLQCVSRTLSDIVSNPALVAMHLQYKTTIRDLDPPQLRVLSFDLDLQRRMSLGPYRLVFVYFGLLGFELHGGKLFLYNPIRSELLKLPICEVDRNYKSFDIYGMGFDAVTCNHKLVYGYYYSKFSLFLAHVHVLGTNLWRRIPSVPPCRCRTRICMNVYAYGKIHWMVDHSYPCDIKRDFILNFDIEREEFGWTPHLNLSHYSQPICLINMRGFLTLVIGNNDSDTELEIWTLRDYSQRWEKYYCIDINRLICTTYDRYGGAWFLGAAWEHGVVLLRDDVSRKQYLDFYNLRTDARMCTQLKLCDSWREVFGYTPGLISLNKYGELLEPAKWPKYFKKMKLKRIV